MGQLPEDPKEVKTCNPYHKNTCKNTYIKYLFICVKTNIHRKSNFINHHLILPMSVKRVCCHFV